MNEPPATTPPATREEIRAGYGLVVRRHREQLISFLWRMTGCGQTAADLAQETFVKAYFSLDRFEDGRPFGPWLFTIAANQARDHLRRHRMKAVAFEDGLETASLLPAPDRELSLKEGREALDAAIGLLPLALREPILLHYQLDWPVADIARHLRINEGAVKTRMHRGRQRLHELLSPEGSAS